MCGIAGIINGNNVDMTGLLNHRGPDGRSQTNIGIVNFQHTRLSVIDLSDKGQQPLESEHYLLTYNGEIYNYKELKGYYDEFPGNDTVTLLNHLDRFGINQTLSDINGMYAFAAYDKTRQLVHLAVDRTGQKPLYYYHSGKFLAFASTPNALLWCQDKWKIDQNALESYWILGGIMGENSIFSGIKRINAAEIATFDIQTGNFWKETYWEPQFQENTSGIEDLVLDSIRKVKVSDVPVHIFLSGGVDSTIVASQCHEFDAIHLDGPERKYAEQVCSKFGQKLIVVDPVNFDAVEAMTDYVVKSGEPAMAALIPWIVSRETSKFGKVAITANGADELFFGYNRTKQEIDSEQLSHLFRGYSAHKVKSISLNDNRMSLGRWAEIMWYVQYDLNATLDRAAMCHGLEVRSPYLDHRLIEMALSIHESVHRNGYGNKSILKKILKDLGFNESFFQRPKLGFSLFRQPHNLDNLNSEAFQWCIDNKFLNCNPAELTPRDRKYLEASAFSFKTWHETYEHILY